MTYEGLTNDLTGAEVTKGLNEFLGKAEGVDPIDRESVPCVWKAVVKNQPPEHQKEQIQKLQSSKAGSESELGGKAAVGKSGGESLGSAPNVANAAPTMEIKAVSSEPVEQQSENKIWPSDTKPPQTVYLDQTQQHLQQLQGIGLQMPIVENQQMFQQMPVENQMFQQQPQQMMPADSQMFQQPQQMMPGGSQMLQPQQMMPVDGQMFQPQQMMPTDNQMFQQPQAIQQYGQYPEVQQYQQPIQMQYQPNQMQYQPGNLRHRRLDPGHHDSQRKGPNVPRPYTVKQLELMMKMLKELGDRYSDDVRINNIMIGYYEKVEKAKNELVAGGT